MLISIGMVSHDQKYHVSSHFNHHYLRNLVVPLTIPQYHMMPKQMVSHDEKGYVVIHLNCIGLSNAVVLLMILPALCEADV